MPDKRTIDAVRKNIEAMLVRTARKGGEIPKEDVETYQKLVRAGEKMKETPEDQPKNPEATQVTAGTDETIRKI